MDQISVSLQITGVRWDPPPASRYSFRNLPMANCGPMINQISTNVRFLLWQKEINHADWQAWLATRATLPSDVCGGLVRGTLPDAEISGAQLRLLAEALGIDE